VTHTCVMQSKLECVQLHLSDMILALPSVCQVLYCELILSLFLF